MGQAFDRDGRVIGEAFGETKREVFDKLNQEFKDAHLAWLGLTPQVARDLARTLLERADEAAKAQ